MLNFAKRTLYKCDTKVKATAYSTLVRPILEYATVVWDPYQQYLVNNIEMVQRRAARWVKQEYSTTSSVTSILNNLEWSTLSKRRQYSRLILFFKFLHQDPPVIRIPDHYLPTSMIHCTRRNHYLHYIPPSSSTTYFQKSFFPRTIIDWNNLPNNIIESDTLDYFISSLRSDDYN